MCEAAFQLQNKEFYSKDLLDVKVYAVDNETKASLKGCKAENWFAESTDYRVFRNEYMRYKHYPSVAANTVEDGLYFVGPSIQASEIKNPQFTVQVVGLWKMVYDCEVLDMPRGMSSKCLILSGDVKYVSASTAVELLDMISRLNSSLVTNLHSRPRLDNAYTSCTHFETLDNQWIQQTSPLP
ncbi:hypothetical protein L3X38_011559 [Prunus dulcis]|uniref:Uncharacterized protein n=1 Tax=Prunus dulcis TaxID=3755 RepID=A0AAD4WHL4_PRUDU|nr:hypothetical protein L3X38_011559 [Prunus dulcis]